jgi:threonine dehydratase
VPDLISLEDVTAAADRIADHVLRTPTVPRPGLAAHLGVPV